MYNKKHMVGIYKITNPKGKIYIGYSKNIEKRWRTYTMLNCKGQKKLYNSLKKYGPTNHNFEIIEECSLVDLNKREVYWVKTLNSVEKGLNLTYGGEGNIPSPETKKRMSEAAKGKIRSEEWRKKYSKSKTNHPMYTDEWRENISKSLKERDVFWGDKISKSTKGRPSPFTGKKHTDETKKRMSEARKSTYKNTHRERPVLQYDKEGNFIKKWDSITKAEISLHPKNKRSTNIVNCCLGKQKSAYGFVWRYKE